MSPELRHRPSGEVSQRNMRTLSPPHYPGTHREQALKWLLDTSGDAWGRGLGKGHWETAQCALINCLLYEWLCSFRHIAVVFLRKRKTIAQRRRKSSDEGARWRWGQHPSTDHPFAPQEGKLSVAVAGVTGWGPGSSWDLVGIPKRPGLH